jgi:hypothetical protein
MSNNQKQQVVALLKSIETGESQPMRVINPQYYTQHNLGAADGLAGVKPCYNSCRHTLPGFRPREAEKDIDYGGWEARGRCAHSI